MITILNYYFYLSQTHKTHNYGSLHIFLFSKGTYGTRRDMSPTPKLASGDYIEYVLGHF